MLLTDILYVAGDSNYSWFYLSKGGRVLTCYPLRHYTALLPDFIRVHKGYLVNPAYVVSLERTGPESAVVSMKNRAVLPVARRRLALVQQVFRQYHRAMNEALEYERTLTPASRLTPQQAYPGECKPQFRRGADAVMPVQ
ncbi:hypothetical protein GCM10027190_02470 [Spirosoma areae]